MKVKWLSFVNDFGKSYQIFFARELPEPDI